MSGSVYYETMRKVARNGIDRQQIHEGDFTDADGILRCGKCKEPRRAYREFVDPDSSNPNQTNRLLVAVKCRCEREASEREKQERQAEKDMAVIQSLKAASLMDERMMTSRFSNFETTKHNEKQLRLCQRYATKFDLMVEKNQGLLFWGNVGTGKSYAAGCIANHLLERKVPVIMTSFVKLMAAMDADRSKSEELIDRLNRAKLVIFDDFGAERGTDTALERVYNIVDSRYRRKLPMILTTNHTLDEMKMESDIRYSRIYDRVFEVCFPVQFFGPSWRKKAANGAWHEMTSLLMGDD